MLLPIKLVCDRRARKDGTSPICIQYCFQPDKRTLLNTDIYIPIRYWNRKLSRISNDLPQLYGNAQILNGRLSLLLRTAEDIVSLAKKREMDDPLCFLKRTFHPNFNIAALEDTATEFEVTRAKNDIKINLDLYYQIDEYSKSKERKVCKDMPRIYRNMKEHLKAFEEFRGESITFERLDLNFYEEFVDFLTYVENPRKLTPCRQMKLTPCRHFKLTP